MRGERRLVREHIRAHLFTYLWSVLVMSVAHAMHAMFPEVLGRFTDALTQQRLTAELVLTYAIILLGIGVGYGVLFGYGQFVNHRLGRKFEFNTRQSLFAHFTRLSEAYFSKNGIGKLLSYVMNDVTTVRESIANALNQLTSAIIVLVTALIMMVISGVPLIFIGACVLPLLSIPIMVTYFGPKIRQRSAQVQESLAKMTESAEEQFGGIRVAKTFAIESIAEKRFGVTVDRIREHQLKLVRSASLFQSLIPFAAALSFVVAILYGGFLTAQGQISLGDFVAVTLYLRMLMGPLQNIGQVINTMQRARASLDRLGALLAEDPDIRDAEDAAELAAESADIEVRGLHFTYPGAANAALRDINLFVPSGNTLGIVGRTGSGKTTLVKLLLRVYDSAHDQIFVGGVDIRDLTLESLRTQVAYVPQDGFLFSTTIGDNIAFSNREMDADRVEEAAKLAEIYGSIKTLPDRFETVLGERGLTLSGGQRQRTSLARGLVKRAPILILDDSVSAVDAITESGIISNIRRSRKDKTTILIAHRISALKHADEIVVLDEGRIIERGTHDQLLAAGGYYASLCEIQGEAAGE
jgi:ATP-binding cassette subfamily B multidrug efflux pump